MNVLSLFDGMSCGRIALDKAEIKVENYYASEIDKYSQIVSQNNYPDIIRLGDITKHEDWNLPKIDLLIGGSPCQGFSFSGKQLNFEDYRSKLFFEYVKILNKLKKENPNIKFLLENVNMKKEYQDVISEFLGVLPIRINSNLVSAQNRNRLYWTNIENIKIEQKNVFLEDILDLDESNYIFWSEEQMKKWNKKEYVRKDYYRIEPMKGKTQCLMAQMGMNKPKIYNSEKNKFRLLTPIEWERLQTVPDNYTSSVSNSQRYKMLGNGWTVDIIKQIFKSLKNE